VRQAAVSIGPAKAADVLRTALAMGADDAIHVEIPADTVIEPLGVSKSESPAARWHAAQQLTRRRSPGCHH
jgi:electron transfer flavoprotein alpha/beta subunit